MKQAEKEVTDRLAYDDLIERLNDLLIQSSDGYLAEIDARFYSLFKQEDHCLLDYLSSYEKYLYAPKESLEEQKEVLKKEKTYCCQRW